MPTALLIGIIEAISGTYCLNMSVCILVDTLWVAIENIFLLPLVVRHVSTKLARRKKERGTLAESTGLLPSAISNARSMFK